MEGVLYTILTLDTSMRREGGGGEGKWEEEGAILMFIVLLQACALLRSDFLLEVHIIA